MPVLSLPGSIDLLSLHQADPQRYPALLETASGDGWDILLAFPQQTLLFKNGEAQQCLAQLDAAWRDAYCVADPATGHLPFRGGWFLYLGYELLEGLEPTVSSRPVDADFPLAAIIRVPAAVMVNRRSGEIWLFAETDYAGLLDTLQHDLTGLMPAGDIPITLEDLHEAPEQDFLEGVGQIQRYIHAGDVFQVNLSRRWHGRVKSKSPAPALYQTLRHSNPAPFSGLVRLTHEHAIISSSPERLVQVQAGMVHTRPIAGTHPRHSEPEKDAQTCADLIAHPKERAEHVMLVDLERNDLGRVCVPGSVRVAELMTVASYAYVHHIESTVVGKLQAGITPVQVIRALFPGGTITGCPKVRTMQIIRELEATPRYAYTGSMGYLNRDGDMDLNILIRTIMVSGEHIRFSAGAGIVADSDPATELNETRAKAKGLLRALGLAG
ncbi:MAG: aminodeoxychorismate synthase component I [Pseudomonadota bacterium]